MKNNFISPSIGLVKSGEVVELDRVPKGIEKIYLREFTEELKQEEPELEDEQ